MLKADFISASASDERRYQSGRRGHDSIVGTMVKICKGHYKGSRGRVVDIKGQSVRIELESQMRIVTGKFLQLPWVLPWNLKSEAVLKVNASFFLYIANIDCGFCPFEWPVGRSEISDKVNVTTPGW